MHIKRLIPILLTTLFTVVTTGAFAASDVQAQIEDQGLILTLFGIFVGGVAISLTPCVYPMIPITLSIIGARSAESKPLVGFLRSLVFVLGIATIYTVLGLIVALSGGTVGFLLQNKAVILGMSVLFIVMGLGMLGLFNLQLPPSIAAKFQGKGGNKGGFFGAFLLGITTGVVASPCGSPVLVGILVLAGAKGQALLGATMLFTYAMGIGLLFLVLGAFPAFLSKVPKSGVWMEDVKKCMGLVLIIASFYYLKQALPVLLVWGMLIATCLIFAGLVAAKARERESWPKLLWAWRLTGLALVGIAMYTALSLVPQVLEKDAAILERHKTIAAGGRSSQTTETTTLTSGSAAMAKPPAEWLASEPEAIALAKANGWPVIVDFGAEWCAACKQLEHETFAMPDVEKAMAGFVKVRIDCTEDTEQTQALQKKYNSLSLPTVAFIDAAGNFIPDLNLYEFEGPAAFKERLAKVPVK